MEGVKRAKSVQKKIVHNILSVLFANSDAFPIGRGTHCLRISLSWFGPLEAFSYMALDILTEIADWHTPCVFPVRDARADQNRKEICR